MKFNVTVNEHKWTINIYHDYDDQFCELRKKYATAYPKDVDEDHFAIDYIVTSSGFVMSALDYNVLEQFCKEHRIDGRDEHPVDVIANLLMAQCDF
jgi:hypothetical protein